MPASFYFEDSPENTDYTNPASVLLSAEHFCSGHVVFYKTGEA
jgi:hypothetical protein